MAQPKTANIADKNNKQHADADKLTKKPSPNRHRNATTTPEMRQFIKSSEYSVSQLAKILNISEATVRKWRKRDSISDIPNTPHHLKTTLSPMEEYVVVGLRYQLKMSLDKLLKITQKFINPNVSRSGLARCLKRYGVSKLDEVESPHVPERYFNQLPIALDSDIATYTLNSETLAQTLAISADQNNVVQVVSLTIPPQLTHEQHYSILLGIDVDSDWVYLDIYKDSHNKASTRYMTHVLKHGPFHLRKLLVKNYHVFLDRFPGARVLNSPEVSNQTQHSATDLLNNGDSL